MTPFIQSTTSLQAVPIPLCERYTFIRIFRDVLLKTIFSCFHLIIIGEEIPRKKAGTLYSAGPKIRYCSTFCQSGIFDSGYKTLSYI